MDKEKILALLELAKEKKATGFNSLFQENLNEKIRNRLETYSINESSPNDDLDEDDLDLDEDDLDLDEDDLDTEEE